MRRARERRGHTPDGEAAAAAHAPAPPLLVVLGSAARPIPMQRTPAGDRLRVAQSCDAHPMTRGRGVDADLDARYRRLGSGSFIGSAGV